MKVYWELRRWLGVASSVWYLSVVSSYEGSYEASGASSEDSADPAEDCAYTCAKGSVMSSGGRRRCCGADTSGVSGLLSFSDSSAVYFFISIVMIVMVCVAVCDLYWM